ncbi:hypothetical protein F0562_005640 [Nyssa sinensis]|uniref:Secreted protein n=1 Tax=Nyssa sinensis TaxID=561372 RepID=A0A5J5AP80_9ASTE|nr:hypothetical protein F0562_005640 [Nyssa sinensis]
MLFVCMLLRLYQLVLIRNGMRALHGPLKVLQKARSFTFHARIRAKWGRVHSGKLLSRLTVSMVMLGAVSGEDTQSIA